MSNASTITRPEAEFEVKPEAVIIYSPDNVDWNTVHPDTLEDYGLIGEVSTEGLRAQYRHLTSTLEDHGISLVRLGHILDEGDLEAIDKNINLIFTRDPATTIPWTPELYIPSSMSLATRRTEVPAMQKALASFGMSPMIDLDPNFNQFAEGGDLYPTVIDDKRTLLVGVGTRTTRDTAYAIARQLVPEVFDQVLLLQHDPEILHLDTGFTPLPNKTLFVAQGMFIQGQLLDTGNPSGIIIDNPNEYFRSIGYTIIETTKHEAVKNETVNMAPVGNNTFVGFPIPPETRKELEDASGATFVEIPGDQIAPAQGGAHCLTRPIYTKLRP